MTRPLLRLLVDRVFGGSSVSLVATLSTRGSSARGNPSASRSPPCPDARFTAVTEVFLNANEFHNARVTVRVSVIDMLTNDPTYVPAQ